MRVEAPPVGITQLLVAVAASEANERKQPVVEDELITRYWLPPSVTDGHCTGVGAEVAAVSVTVLPVIVNAPETAIMHSKEAEVLQPED